MKIEKTEEEEAGVKHKKRWIVMGVLLIVLLSGGLFFAQRSVYSRAPGDPVLTFLVSVFPFPAAKVGTMMITMKEYVIEYKALESSFSASTETEQPPSPEKLQETILQTLINKRVIALLAKQYNVFVNPERVEAYFKQTIGEDQSEEAFADELNATFGWTVEEFKKRVIEPIVLAIDTNAAILNNDAVQTERRSFIEAARARVVAGEEFSTVAKEAMDPFGLNESDLGFFLVSTIPEQWRASVDALNVGEISEVLENNDVFTFFKVTERNEGSGDAQLHLLTITIPKKTLEDAVKDYLSTAEVKRYIGT